MPLLEPFGGHLSPKIDKVSEELTLRYPHKEPCVDPETPWPEFQAEFPSGIPDTFSYEIGSSLHAEVLKNTWLWERVSLYPPSAAT